MAKGDIDALGMSVAEAAKGLGVTRQQLHNVVTGRSAVTPKMALRFEKAFGGTADTWLRMQLDYDLAVARKRLPFLRIKVFAPRAAWERSTALIRA